MTTDPHQPPAGPPGGTGATPQGSPAAGPTPPDAAPGLRFFNSIRGLGIVRPDEGRLAAGVCTGLARRFGVDPLLVRGVFVVLAVIGGFGVGLYGLLWLLLPHPDGRIHAEGVLHGVVTAGFAGGLILFLGDFASGLRSGGPPFWFAAWGPPRALIFWALVLVAVAFWATRGGHRRLQWPQPPAGGPGYPPYGGASGPGSGSGSGSAPAPAPAPGTGPRTGGSGGPAPSGETPYGTGPGGTAHPGQTYPGQTYPGQTYPGQTYPGQTYPGQTYPGQTYPGQTHPGPDYPAPGWGSTAGMPSPAAAGTVAAPPAYAPTGPVFVPPPRLDLQKPSHPLTLAVLGLALVGAAAVVMWDHLVGPLPAHAGLVAMAVALGIVALGVILAGLLGRRSGGLAPIAVLLALVSILGAVGHGVHSPFGPTRWQPLSADSAESGYTQGAGDVTLDLTQPGLVTGRSADAPVDIPVQLGVGRIRIVVPDGSATQIDASVGAGNIDDSVNGNRSVSSGNGGGAGVKRTVHTHGDTPVILVRVNVGLGSVEIVPQGQAVTS
jgi:phage shock protein PspC (stress-responsive transcriptional regulator)